MVFLTLLVALRLVYFNTTAVLGGRVHIKHYRLFDDKIPKENQAVSQHYKNMFEMPLLFYLLIVLLLVTDSVTNLDIQLAWGFVFFRILHSFVRIPNRNVHPRFTFFVGSYLMLVAGWINFAVRMM